MVGRLGSYILTTDSFFLKQKKKQILEYFYPSFNKKSSSKFQCSEVYLGSLLLMSKLVQRLGIQTFLFSFGPNYSLSHYFFLSL